jgi:hypothetical protein
MRGHVGKLAVLREQFCQPRYTVSLGFNDIIKITAVMVLGWSKVPRVDSLHCFASKWGQGVPVPVVWSVEDFLCQFRWVDS